VKRSAQVMEWQAEAEAKARAEDILEVLQLRFGEGLPDDFVAKIRGTADLPTLKRWLILAVQARTVNKFRQGLES
jgi:hypothetical protein